MSNFYRLPTKNGLLDWDCAEALDIPAMAESLAYIRQHAAFPVNHMSLVMMFMSDFIF